MNIKDSYLHGEDAVIKKLEFTTGTGDNANKPVLKITKASLTNNVDDTDEILTGYSAHYIVGPTSDTVGSWTGTDANIKAYYDGLEIIYVPGVAGASTTTLKINSLAACDVYLFNTSRLTTHYSVGTPIRLIYKGGKWYNSVYDANSKEIRTYFGQAGEYPIMGAKTRGADATPMIQPSTYYDAYGEVSAFDKAVTLNPVKGTITAAGGFVGNLSGNASTASNIAGNSLGVLYQSSTNTTSIVTNLSGNSKTGYLRQTTSSTGVAATPTWVESIPATAITLDNTHKFITATERTNWDAVHNWYSTAAGADSSGVIDNWNEIKNFVASFKETDDLATYLSNNYLAKSGGTVTGTLILSRTTDAAGTANNKPALIIGGTDSQSHIEIDSNEIMAKTNGTSVAALYLNNDGGDVYVNGKKVVLTDDSRLSDARTPTSHTHGNITSDGKKTSYTADTDSGLFLRADGTWATPSYTTNTDNTAIFLGTVANYVTNKTKKTDTTKITKSSSTGLAFVGGTNKFYIGDGTNYIEVGVAHGLSTKNMNINGTDYALYTSASSLPTILAPTSAGTSGYILTSQGSGKAPSWTALSSITSGNSDKLDGFHATKFLQMYSREDIGTSPNYDNPTVTIGNDAVNVNGVFEIRGSAEVTGESGTRPFDGYGTMVCLRGSNTIFLIAATTSSIKWREILRSKPTLANLSWKTFYHSGNFSVTLNGTATTSASFYAPTSYAGTGGYVLATNANKNGLEWVANPDHTYTLTLNGSAKGTSGGTNLGTFYAVATSDATAASQVWMRNSNNTGYAWRTLGSRAFDSTSYLPLAGGTMSLGEGLKFHADGNYFGENADARIISLMDSNGETCGGGLIIDERGVKNGVEVATELLRIRHSEFKWKGTNISLEGHTHNYAGSSTAGGSADYVRWGGASSDVSRRVPFAYDGSVETTDARVRLVYNDKFQYNPATDTLKVGKITGNAATASSVAWSGITGKPLSSYDSNTTLSPYNAMSTGYYKFLTLVSDNGNSGLIDFIISDSEVSGDNMGRAEYFHFTSRPSSTSRECYYISVGKNTSRTFGSKIYIVDGTTKINDVDYKTYIFYLHLDKANSWLEFCNIKQISAIRWKSVTWSNTWQTADPGTSKWQPSLGGHTKYSDSAGSVDWANTGHPSWIGDSKPTYTLDEVSDGDSRKLSNYLPLTGGTIAQTTWNNQLHIWRKEAVLDVGIGYYYGTTKTLLGVIGFLNSSTHPWWWDGKNYYRFVYTGAGIKDATVGNALTPVYVNASGLITTGYGPTTVVNGVSLSLGKTSWTDACTINSNDSGSYMIKITSGNLIATGTFSIYKDKTDSNGDEIPLHVFGSETWRPYARTLGTKLQLASNLATAANKTVTVVIKRLL